MLNDGVITAVHYRIRDYWYIPAIVFRLCIIYIIVIYIINIYIINIMIYVHI